MQSVSNYPFRLVAWTGGDRPPRRFADPEFRQMRRALFREQLAVTREFWGAGTTQLDTVRIFWRRAHADAWRSFTSAQESKS